MPKRQYVLRDQQTRLNMLLEQIQHLEAAHAKRYAKIGQLREKAHALEIELTPKEVSQEVEIPNVSKL